MIVGHLDVELLMKVILEIYSFCHQIWPSLSSFNPKQYVGTWCSAAASFSPLYIRQWDTHLGHQSIGSNAHPVSCVLTIIMEYSNHFVIGIIVVIARCGDSRWLANGVLLFWLHLPFVETLLLMAGRGLLPAYVAVLPAAVPGYKPHPLATLPS